jgi:DNA-binding protein H-NS
LQSGKGRATKVKGKAAKVGKSTPAKAKKTEKVAAVVAAKFRGPNGETWSGRGLTPRWLAALLAQGKTKDEFAVQS